MKKLKLLSASVVCGGLLCLTGGGCIDTSKFQTVDDSAWLTRQYEQGAISAEKYKVLINKL